MSRIIDTSAPLSEDELTYLRDRGLDHVIAQAEAEAEVKVEVVTETETEVVVEEPAGAESVEESAPEEVQEVKTARRRNSAK